MTDFPQIQFIKWISSNSIFKTDVSKIVFIKHHCIFRYSVYSGAHESQPGAVQKVTVESSRETETDFPQILFPVYGGCATHCL